MGLADAVLGHEQTASREPKAGARTPFDGVNDLDPVAVADALGIERDGRKVKCCPGCGASSGCDIMDRGIVCQHDTCKAKTHNHDGFYSNVDLIALVRRGTVREAIGWASERFGTAQWINREPTTHAPEGAPKSTTPYDGGPWLSTSTIFEPLPPPAFVVPDLQIGPGRASCFAAYAGAGKTIAMQSLALSVASEQPIWGWFRHRGPGRVRHADQDQGAGTLRRYQRLARGMGLRPEDLGGRLEVSTFPELYLVDTSDDVWLRACDGVDLMILDALRGFMPGIDENDSAIQRYLMRLPKISEATGCSFLLAHHFGKPQAEAKPELERLRGSSGIGAALGSVFVLTGDRGEPKTITHVKSHPEASGGLVEDFALAIEDVASDDGVDLHWGLRCTHKTPEQIDPPQNDDARFQQVCRRILDVVKANPGISGRGIRARIDRVRQDTILEAIEALAIAGRIENMGSDRAAKWFPTAGTTDPDLEVDDAAQ